MSRKTNLVAYFYKKKTKYPERIYLFYLWEQWNQRNLRPMGLHGSQPFLVREMTELEIEEVRGMPRLRYHSYDNWCDLLVDEFLMGCKLIWVDRVMLYYKAYPLSTPELRTVVYYQVKARIKRGTILRRQRQKKLKDTPEKTEQQKEQAVLEQKEEPYIIEEPTEELQTIKPKENRLIQFFNQQERL